MTDELRQQVQNLRAIAPRLNSASDGAARVVSQVEAFLEGLSLGIPAKSGIFSEIPAPGREDSCRIHCRLAYGRVGDKFRIHVLEEFMAKDDDGDWTEAVGFEPTVWSSCPRSVKLASFARLPDLLGVLADKASRLVGETDQTTATVEELLRAIEPSKPTGDKVGGLTEGDRPPPSLSAALKVAAAFVPYQRSMEQAAAAHRQRAAQLATVTKAPGFDMVRIAEEARKMGRILEGIKPIQLDLKVPRLDNASIANMMQVPSVKLPLARHMGPRPGEA